MRFPFVLRSTYDALKLEREASAQAAKGLYAANIELIETQRRGHETLQQQQGRIEDYKRTCETRDEIIAGSKHHIAEQDATIAILRGYVTARDVVIATLEQKIAELRMLGDADQQLIIQESTRADEAEKQLAAATKSPARPPRRSKLTEAIREQATLPDGSVDPRLLNHFRNRASTLRRQGKKEADIIEAIGIWSTTEVGESAITVDAIVANMSAEAIP